MNSPDWLLELKNYPAGVLEELRKVSWPSKEEVRKQTLIVLAIVTVSSLFVAGLDWNFRQLVTMIIG